MKTSSETVISALSHLECSGCGKTHAAERLQTLWPTCKKSLLARYDLDGAARTLTKDSVAGRPRGMWRWRELMPVRDERYIVTLGEGDTPLLPARRLGARFDCKNLFIKDE